MKVSIVSVSRWAGSPQLGQGTLRQSANLLKGEPPLPLNSTSSGKITGSSASGTGNRTATGTVDDGEWDSPNIAVWKSSQSLRRY